MIDNRNNHALLYIKLQKTFHYISLFHYIDIILLHYIQDYKDSTIRNIAESKLSIISRQFQQSDILISSTDLPIWIERPIAHWCTKNNKASLILCDNKTLSLMETLCFLSMLPCVPANISESDSHHLKSQ